MTIHPYQPTDEQACMAVFDSNCPRFFDLAERDLFAHWLRHQSGEGEGYGSPTYQGTDCDANYVIELPGSGIVACGGFYINTDPPEARLAWGMVHADHHRTGLGTALFAHRKDIITSNWPRHVLTLGTSQHTYAFYEKMGMTVLSVEKSGYGPDLDKVDMRG